MIKKLTTPNYCTTVDKDIMPTLQELEDEQAATVAKLQQEREEKARQYDPEAQAKYKLAQIQQRREELGRTRTAPLRKVMWISLGLYVSCFIIIFPIVGMVMGLNGDIVFWSAIGGLLLLLLVAMILAVMEHRIKKAVTNLDIDDVELLGGFDDVRR